MNAAFYSTAAQVIPLLVVVLVVETRTLSEPASDTPTWAIVWVVGMSVLSAWAELDALYVLKDGHPSVTSGTIVMGALSALVLTVFYIPLYPNLDELRRRRKRHREKSRGND